MNDKHIGVVTAKDFCKEEVKNEVISYITNKVKNSSGERYFPPIKSGPKPTKTVIARKLKEAEKALDNTAKFIMNTENIIEL